MAIWRTYWADLDQRFGGSRYLTRYEAGIEIEATRVRSWGPSTYIDLRGAKLYIESWTGVDMTTSVSGGAGSVILTNTGSGSQRVDTINTGIQNLAGRPETQDVGKALEAVLDAVKNDAALSDDQRKKILKHLDLITGEATSPKAERDTSLVQVYYDNITKAIGAAAAAGTAWHAWGPAILKFFGL